MPHALWHHVGMDDERRRRLRRLGRAYRAAMEAEKKAREALAAEVLAALDAKEPVGEVAREAGFDREWVRRARIAEEKRLADERATTSRRRVARQSPVRTGATQSPSANAAQDHPVEANPSPDS